MAAGESASERARRMREKAARLERAAAKWEQGAEGERLIGGLLDQLPPEFVVFHDVKLPGSKANVDHLVVGPGGIWCIDAKNYSHPVRFGTGKGAGTLWSGRWALTKTLETSAWEASVVAELVGYPVASIVCVIAPSLPRPAFDFRELRVCSPTSLLAEFRRGHASIDVGAAVGAIRMALDAEPSVRSAWSAPHASFPPPQSPTSNLPSGQPAVRARRKLTAREVNGLKLVGIVVLLLVGLPLLPRVAGSVGQWFGNQVAEDLQEIAAQAPSTSIPPDSTSTTSTTTSTTVPPVPAPPAPLYTATCAPEGRAWDVSVVWPGEPPPGVGTVGLRVLRGSDSFRLTHERAEWTERLPISVRLDPHLGDYWIAVEYLAENGFVIEQTAKPFAEPATPC